MKLKRKTILITGATAGIGRACAEIFAEAGARLVLLARREKELKSLASELLSKFGAEVLSLECDVRDRKQLKQLFDSMPNNWKNLNILINNAGLAQGLDKIQDGNIDDWETMIDTNIKGLLYTTRYFLPGMVEKGSGLVINIASIAGKMAYPMGNVYCATKSAVKALSEAMAIDLNGTGVRVCNIDPGLVETEFALVRFKGDKEKATAVYKGYTPLSGYDIADVALFVATRPAHVMIQDITITPTDQANPYILNKHL